MMILTDFMCLDLRVGRSLLSVEDTVQHEQLSMQKYLACSTEPLLQLVYQCSQSSAPPESRFKIKTVENKNILKLGKQSPCTDSLSERLMVLLMPRSNGSG